MKFRFGIISLISVSVLLSGCHSEAEIHNYKGIRYLENGFLEQALLEFNLAISLQPDFVDAIYNRGKVYFSSQAYENALENFNMAILLDPSNYLYLQSRGVLYLDLGQYDKALDDTDFAIELNPSSGLSFQTRGRVLFAQGHYYNARGDFKKAILLSPEIADNHLYLGRVKAQIGILNDALSQYDFYFEKEGFTAFALNERGMVKYDLEDYIGAYGDISKAIKLDPENALYAHNLGLVYGSKEYYVTAIQQFSKAIEFDSGMHNAYLFRAFARFELEEYESAFEDAEKYIERGDDNPYAYFLKGKVLENKESYGEALQYYLLAYYLDPMNAEFSESLSRAFYETGKIPEAKAFINQAVERNPDGVDSYFFRGYLKLKYSTNLAQACHDLEIASARGSLEAVEYLVNYCK